MALSDSLVAYWSLADTSDAVGSNTLTNNNSATFVTGHVGNAVDLERDNSQYLSIADNAALAMGDIDCTFACWINAESLAGFPVVFRKGSTINTDVSVVLYYDTTANRLKFGAAGTYTEVTWGSALSTGTWYYVVCWHDSVNNHLGISVNAGIAVTTNYTAGIANSAFPLHIGASTIQSLYWDGLIDEFGVWKRVLTSDEITELYNGGSGRDYAYIAGGSEPEPIEGTLSATLGDATVTAAATLDLAGTLTATFAAASLSSAATLAISGVVAATLDDATLAATGDIEAGPEGQLTATLENAALVATGTLAIAGQSTVTLAAATLSATAAVAITGNVTATLEAVSLNAIGVEVVIVAIVRGSVRGVGRTGRVRGVSQTGSIG